MDNFKVGDDVFSILKTDKEQRMQIIELNGPLAQCSYFEGSESTHVILTVLTSSLYIKTV